MRLIATAALVTSLGLVASGATRLEIYFIDTEGGQATLLVTPAGESVLIDAGYGARNARGRGPAIPADRDATRIVDAARTTNP